MQVQLVLTAGNGREVKKLSSILGVVSNAYEDITGDETLDVAPVKSKALPSAAADEDDDVAPAKKRGRPKKSRDEDEDEDEAPRTRKRAGASAKARDDDEGEDDAATEDDEDEEDEEPRSLSKSKDKGEPKKKKKITFEDVSKAFKTYAAEHTRQRAMKILKKFDVSSTQDIPEDRYEEAMELLQA